jgi:hypothetical protein
MQLTADHFRAWSACALAHQGACGAPDACSAVSFPYKQLTELLVAVLLALYGGFKHVTISPDMKLGQQTR